MNKQRLEGLEKEISRLISKLLFGKIKNKKIDGLVTVTDVTITRDLKFVDLKFSILELSNHKVNKKRTLEGLEESKGYFRKQIAENIKIRHIPELRISLDTSIENAIKISKILDKIN